MSVVESISSPAVVTSITLSAENNGEKIILATHTDSIQAMLLTASRHPELGVMIKGRVGATEEVRITTDALFNIFTKSRIERAEALRQRMRKEGCEGGPYLSVEQSAEGQSFACRFFQMNKLVTEVFAGKVNANTLMPHFGGATELEVGSDLCNQAELADYAREMAWEIRARQMGELPWPILKNRLHNPN